MADLPEIKVAFGFGNYDDLTFDLIQESDGSGTVRMDLSGVFSASSYALRHTLRAGYDSRLSSALKGRASLNTDVTKNWKLRVPSGLEVTGIGGETSDQYVSDDPYGYSITRGPYDVPNSTIIDITIDGTVYNVPLKQADGRTAHSIVDEIRSVIGTDGGSVGDAYVQYDTYSEANRIYIYSRGHKKIDIETKINGTASRAVFRWSVLGTPAPDSREGSIWDPTSDAREAMAFSDWEKVGEISGYQIYQMKTGLTHTVLGDKDGNYGRELSKGRFDRYGRSRMMENTWLSFQLPLKIDLLRDVVLGQGQSSGEPAPAPVAIAGAIDIDRLRDEAGWRDFPSREDTLVHNAHTAVSFVEKVLSRPVLPQTWKYWTEANDGFIVVSIQDYLSVEAVNYYTPDDVLNPTGRIDIGDPTKIKYEDGCLIVVVDSDIDLNTDREYPFLVRVKKAIDFSGDNHIIIKNAIFQFALGLCREADMERLVKSVRYELSLGEEMGISDVEEEVFLPRERIA